MLPQSHVAYTLLAYDLAADRVEGLRDLDYRIVALASLGPDLIDKPLAAAYFYRRYKSAVLFAHTLIAHVALLWWTLRRRPAWLPYTLAFNSHIITDRLWFFQDTFYWPLRGWRFHVWRKAGSEQQDIGKAYWYAFTRRPELWAWELGGLIALGWFVLRHRLYRPRRLLAFLLTGRLPRSRR
ncbi:MAG: hypothetical protein Kow0047_27170 [Anaerolineae bacterium]